MMSERRYQAVRWSVFVTACIIIYFISVWVNNMAEAEQAARCG